MVLTKVMQRFARGSIRLVRVLGPVLGVTAGAALASWGAWLGWESTQSGVLLQTGPIPLSSDRWRMLVGATLLLGTIPVAAYGWKAARLWWLLCGGLGLILTAGPHSSWELRVLVWSCPLLFEHFRDRSPLVGISHERFATTEEMRSHLLDLGDPRLTYALLVGQLELRSWWRRRAVWVALQPTPERPEVGHGLVIAPTGLGKGLALVSQLLANTGHSAIVLDLKGEAYRLTSGARAAAGHRIFRLDLSGSGSGHRYDPTAQAQDEDDLRVLAQVLTHDPQDRDPFWAHAAEEMLTAAMLAARRSGSSIFPFLRTLLDQGLKGADEILRAIDPALAARFVPGGRLDSKLVVAMWTTLVVRLRPLLTDRMLTVLESSDFSAADLRNQRITVYITVPEAHLERLAPVLAAVWTGLIGSIIAHADANAATQLRPLLLILDEAGRIPIPRLPGYLATLRSRAVSCLVYVQSFSQLRHAYGLDQAYSISNNCALQIYYQQHDEATAWAVSRRLGEVSDFARGFSVTEVGIIPGVERTTRTAAERLRPLLTPQQVMRLPEHTALVFYRDLPPMWINRLDWRELHALREWANIPPVDLPRLTPWAGVTQRSWLPYMTEPAAEYVDPDG